LDRTSLRLAHLFDHLVGSSTLKRQLGIVADRDAPLFMRTLAAWHACGTGREDEQNGFSIRCGSTLA
jgi:hypothetical protein